MLDGRLLDNCATGASVSTVGSKTGTGISGAGLSDAIGQGVTGAVVANTGTVISGAGLSEATGQGVAGGTGVGAKIGTVISGAGLSDAIGQGVTGNEVAGSAIGTGLSEALTMGDADGMLGARVRVSDGDPEIAFKVQEEWYHTNSLATTVTSRVSPSIISGDRRSDERDSFSTFEV